MNARTFCGLYVCVSDEDQRHVHHRGDLQKQKQNINESME